MQVNGNFQVKLSYLITLDNLDLITGRVPGDRHLDQWDRPMPWMMSTVIQSIKLSRTALIMTRLRRTVGLTRELELTVVVMTVGEVGVVGVPAVKRVARGERYGPGSVNTLAMEGPSVQAQLRKGAAAEQQTAQLS